MKQWLLANEAQLYFQSQEIPIEALFSRSADIKELSTSLNNETSSTYKVVISVIDINTLQPILVEAPINKSAELDYTKIISDKLSYKIQVASVKKPYQKALFTKHPDAMMEKSSVKDYYRCTLGLFDNFKAAKDLMQQLRTEGVKSAFVVPYLLGKRLEPRDVKKYKDQLPDLSNYRR